MSEYQHKVRAVIREEMLLLIYEFDLIWYFILCHDFNVKINVLFCLGICSNSINDTFFLHYVKIQATIIKFCAIVRKKTRYNFEVK